jgi:amino acid transporter
MTTLHRALRWQDGVGVTVGVCIGSGIFASPGQILVAVGSPGLGLVTWCLAGVLALCSSLVYCELGPAIPQAGGDRDYICRAFGKAAAFAYTFTMFFVIKPGSQAILGVTFARYAVAMAVPDDPSLLRTGADSDPRVKGAAIASVLALTLLNCLGVQSTSRVQNVLTLLKLALVGLVLAAAAASLSTAEGQALASENLGADAFNGSTPLGLGPALIGALWAFDGWNDIVFLAEELQDPSTLPVRRSLTPLPPHPEPDLTLSLVLTLSPSPPQRIITASLAVVASAYVIINLGYMAVLTPHQATRTSIIAVDTVTSALGQWAFSPTALLVSISVLGSNNASIMSTPHAPRADPSC